MASAAPRDSRGRGVVREDNWLISELEFDPQALHHRETVFTIGNGYLGTRGAFEEGYPGDRAATLVHGVFEVRFQGREEV